MYSNCSSFTFWNEKFHIFQFFRKFHSVFCFKTWFNSKNSRYSAYSRNSVYSGTFQKKNSVNSTTSSHSSQCSFYEKKYQDIPNISGFPIIPVSFEREKYPQIQISWIFRKFHSMFWFKVDEIPNKPFIPHIPEIPFVSEQHMKKIPQIPSIQFTVKFQKQNFKNLNLKKIFQNSDYSIILGGSIWKMDFSRFCLISSHLWSTQHGSDFSYIVWC